MENDLICNYKNIPVEAYMKNGERKNLTIEDLGDLKGRRNFSIKKSNETLFSGRAEKYVMCQILASHGLTKENFESSRIKISVYGV